MIESLLVYCLGVVLSLSLIIASILQKKRAAAESIYKSAQKRSKSFIHEPSLKKSKQSAPSPRSAQGNHIPTYFIMTNMNAS